MEHEDEMELRGLCCPFILQVLLRDLPEAAPNAHLYCNPPSASYCGWSKSSCGLHAPAPSIPGFLDTTPHPLSCLFSGLPSPAWLHPWKQDNSDQEGEGAGRAPGR
jgi:hypothetical protein